MKNENIKKDNVLSEIKEIVLNSSEMLTPTQELYLDDNIFTIEQQIDYLEKKLVEIGRLKDYNRLKQSGFTSEQITLFNKEDQQMIDFAQNTVDNHFQIDHDYMFGYPANMTKASYVTNYLRWFESKMYFTNSCGNAYSKGNYRMNNSEQELEIIERVKNNLGLSSEDYWGYITMGGTEANMWGIREGFSKYPNGKIYYSDASHYSVAKMVDMLDSKCSEMIPANNGSIDVNLLMKRILKNYRENQTPAIILLTYGTTTLGSIDNIAEIKRQLDEFNIPNYIHVDAALYGGIPNNQKNSPMEYFSNIASLEIDSISISLHKYVGNQKTNGVLLSRSKQYKKFIDYISQQDITFLGSRDFPTFSTLQRVRELYSRTEPNEYYRSVSFFEKLLQDNNIDYIKGVENGNIFVIKKPSDDVCKKYQLATFSEGGVDYAHIIIFPYHKDEKMVELVDDIVLSMNNKIIKKEM